MIIFTSVIFLYVLWKICCKREANYEDARQPEINTSRRRTRTNLVSPADSTNATLRDQAEAFVYKLPENTVGNYQLLKGALNQRFGHTALKESYIAESKFRRKQDKETFRDFGQAIQDLYRRAYPENREYVLESSMKTFLDNCSASEAFRLAVKRTRPKTLDDAVTAAMQEECTHSKEIRYTRWEILSATGIQH